MKRMQIFFSMLFIYSVAACSGSNIDIVKSSYIDSDKNMTNSQLLDHRKICNELIWSDFIDRNERTVVQYQCELNDSQDFFKNKRDEYINLAIERRDYELKRLNSEYKWLLSDDVKNDYYYRSNPESIKTRLGFLDDQLKSINSNNSDENIINEGFVKYPVYTKVIEIFQWVVNKEKKVSLEFGGLTAYIDNAEPVEINYRNPYLIFQIISKSNSDSFHSYVDYSSFNKLMRK